mgnify:CR=1 FL=1
MIRPMTQLEPNEDPRRRRTRQDLMAAFFSLVLSQRYHEIRVGDVLARSGVSRSTFYEHFRNKDELLAASIAALADARKRGGNRVALARDAAAGQGESLDTLATVMGIKDADRAVFASTVKSNFGTVFADEHIAANLANNV